MTSLFYFLVFLFGLAMGSFLNVVICRLATGEGMAKKRSHCPHCGHFLCWYDMIPVLSFFWLRGRCRYCQKRISWQYPLVEIATGLIFFLVFNFQFSISNQTQLFQFPNFSISNLTAVCYMLYVTCSLLIVFVYDLKNYIIPDKVLFPAVAITFFWQIFSSLKIGHWSLASSHLTNYLLSAFGAAAFFALLILITRGRGMGWGDVKLAFLMGLILGWPTIFVALFLSFFSGSLVGLALIVAGRKKFDSQIPFGPFLAGATILTLFYGGWLVDKISPFFLF